jgi:hypothetical protein
MAQYLGRTRWFEQRWRPALVLAAKVLRDIQGAWLVSEKVFPSREVVAVLVNLFAFDFASDAYFPNLGKGSDGLWRRSVGEWFSDVGSPEDETARLSPNRPESEYNQAVEQLSRMLSSAADSWEHVAVDTPSPEDVVQEMFAELVTLRFLRLTAG